MGEQTQQKGKQMKITAWTKQYWTQKGKIYIVAHKTILKDTFYACLWAIQLG